MYNRLWISCLHTFQTKYNTERLCASLVRDGALCSLVSWGFMPGHDQNFIRSSWYFIEFLLACNPNVTFGLILIYNNKIISFPLQMFWSMHNGGQDLESKINWSNMPCNSSQLNKSPWHGLGRFLETPISQFEDISLLLTLIHPQILLKQTFANLLH